MTKEEIQLKVMVDRDLHTAVKIEAARRRVTLSEVVRDALRAFVGGKKKPTSKQ